MARGGAHPAGQQRVVAREAGDGRRRRALPVDELQRCMQPPLQEGRAGVSPEYDAPCRTLCGARFDPSAWLEQLLVGFDSGERPLTEEFVAVVLSSGTGGAQELADGLGMRRRRQSAEGTDEQGRHHWPDGRLNRIEPITNP